jgi:dual specificity protein kinase YAK1
MDPWQSGSSGPGDRNQYNGQRAHPEVPPGAQQPPAGFHFEPYNQGPSRGLSAGTSPAATPQHRPGDFLDADVQMNDAELYSRNPYNKSAQGSSRPFLQTEDPSQRYSPMTALSPSTQAFTPSSPYATSPQPAAGQYAAFQGPRQSPTRNTPNQHFYPPSGSPRSANLTAERFQSYQSYDQRLPIRSVQPREGVPRFTRLKNMNDLTPQINTQPAFRRANPEGGFISPLQALTTQLPSTYRICNPNFKYESSRNPRRVLTKPSKGTKNDGYDNEDSDYILYVNDILGSEETGHKNRYLILDVLGQGTFGQVVKCQNLRTQEVVAVKVVKNKTAYFNQSMMEVSVLDLLNSKLDKNDDHHLLRLKDTFIHKQHLCLVFELLSVNLYELIKQNQFRGLSTTLVRVFAQQLLNALSLLSKARLIHCDLKPENILLKK